MLEHQCENCDHKFEIIRHEKKIFDHQIYLRMETGKNMVYKGDMNREYAFCPKCQFVEEQFSAEARDQSEGINV